MWGTPGLPAYTFLPFQSVTFSVWTHALRILLFSLDFLQTVICKELIPSLFQETLKLFKQLNFKAPFDSPPSTTTQEILRLAFLTPFQYLWLVFQGLSVAFEPPRVTGCSLLHGCQGVMVGVRGDPALGTQQLQVLLTELARNLLALLTQGFLFLVFLLAPPGGKLPWQHQACDITGCSSWRSSQQTPWERDRKTEFSVSWVTVRTPPLHPESMGEVLLPVAPLPAQGAKVVPAWTCSSPQAFLESACLRARDAQPVPFRSGWGVTPHPFSLVLLPLPCRAHCLLIQEVGTWPSFLL